jgi:hypothetical protein
MRSRIAIALLLAFGSRVVPTVYWIAVLACGFVTLVWIAANRPKWSNARLAGVAAVSLLVLIVALTYRVSRNVGSNYESVDSVTTDTAAVARSVGAPAPPPPRKDAQLLTYQGLPARFELPSGARSGEFHEQLLAADRPQKITIVLLSMTLVTWLAIVMTMSAAFLLWLQRAVIKMTLRERMAAAMAPAPATA